MSYFDISGAVFNNQLRELETSDPAHADVFNAVFRQLINNDVALMEAASMFAGEKNKQAEFILNLKRTGKKYGVHHSAFDVSPLSAGTRTLDAVGMVAQPSTNTVRGRNDFEGESVFYGLEVNGHVDDAGEFIVEYIKGIDNEFSRTERDTWMLYLTQWINITIDANGESLVISDEHHAGFFPEGAAIRTDQTVRPFVAQAKYMAGNGSDGTSVTSDYVECGYSVADTQASWKYISELGYDPENPSVRHGTKVAASSSTGYADGQYTDKLDQTSDGLREWLSGGALDGGSGAGRWCAGLANGLGFSWWNCAARLSASGRCAKAAA